jgi:hypothetical protein
MKEIICHTGGAVGADMLFENLSDNSGFKVISYSFEGHHTDSKHRKILTNQELEDVNPQVEEVSKIIKRRAPFKRPEFIKFVQRDIYQAIYSDIIFGVGIMDWDLGVPHGGTAWAVGMGIILKLPILFFEQEKNDWFKYSESRGWDHIEDKYIIQYYFNLNPVTNFTGIGTRALNSAGEKAINNVVTWFKNQI